MSAPLRLAHVDELPPGQGKVVHFGSRAVTVYNLEGRYFAQVERRAHSPVDGTLPALGPVCQPGMRFDANAEDSPARLRSEGPHACTVENDWIVLYLDDGDTAAAS